MSKGLHEWPIHDRSSIGFPSDAGVDTGIGVALSEIEADPAGYYADIHSTNWLPGVNRGQFV